MSETLIDQLASLARTALDDPEGVARGVVAFAIQQGLSYEPVTASRVERAYAIHKLDEIIGLLNPADETRETFATTLKVLGSHLAERADVMVANGRDADVMSGDQFAYENAADHVQKALDVLDEAIEFLTPDSA